MSDHSMPKPKVSVVDDEHKEASAASAGQAATTAVAGSRGETEADASSSQKADCAEDGSTREKSHPLRNARKSVTGWLAQNFPGHENAVFGGICGLVVAVLVFVIGFWQTLFICACVLVGVGIGQYADGNPALLDALRSLFGRD